MSDFESPIQIAIGIELENHDGPAQLCLHDEGLHLPSYYTASDCISISAILRDVADAIDTRLKQLSN